MIHRSALNLVQSRLAQFDCVALLGPRQVGKTTLAREIAANLGDGARYLDLESPIDRNQLLDAETYFSDNVNRLIVLDEIQCVPEIFQILRGQIDARRRMPSGGGKFLILGSASMELLRQSSESLAGRISFLELGALTLTETLSKDPSGYVSKEIYTYNLSETKSPKLLSPKRANSRDRIHATTDTLWLKGGFPESYLREDDRGSLQWRHDFIQTYLERDIAHFGFKITAEKLGLFWRMLASDQGGLFNAERYARDMRVSGHTVAKYLSALEKLLLVRQLQPWSANIRKRLVKSPRPYVRDTGILHALLDLRTMDDLLSHHVKGKSWEGFVIEALIDAAGNRVRPYFYRTSAGAEADLVLEFAPGRCWAIEIKLSKRPTIDRGFHNSADDLRAERRILIYKGDERFQMSHGVEAIPLLAAIAEVRGAMGDMQ